MMNDDDYYYYESIRKLDPVLKQAGLRSQANFGPVLYQIVSNRQYMYLPLM